MDKTRTLYISFEVEAGVGVVTRSGHSWGMVNPPHIVLASDNRSGYNVFSALAIPDIHLYFKTEVLRFWRGFCG